MGALHHRPNEYKTYGSLEDSNPKNRSSQNLRLPEFNKVSNKSRLAQAVAFTKSLSSVIDRSTITEIAQEIFSHSIQGIIELLNFVLSRSLLSIHKFKNRKRLQTLSVYKQVKDRLDWLEQLLLGSPVASKKKVELYELTLITLELKRMCHTLRFETENLHPLKNPNWLQAKREEDVCINELNHTLSKIRSLLKETFPTAEPIRKLYIQAIA